MWLSLVENRKLVHDLETTHSAVIVLRPSLYYHYKSIFAYKRVYRSCRNPLCPFQLCWNHRRPAAARFTSKITHSIHFTRTPG